MSLNWDARSIDLATREWPCPMDREHPEGKRLSPVTNVLIWTMVALGLDGKITGKNVEEAIIQVMTLQALNGPLLLGDSGAGIYVSPADVRAHIGLTTNVYGKANTKAAFWRNYGKLNREKGEKLARKLADVPALQAGVDPHPAQIVGE